MFSAGRQAGRRSASPSRERKRAVVADYEVSELRKRKMDQPWDRRKFLRNAALAGSAPVLPANEASGMEPAAEPATWFDRPMRWAQLTLVENDPGRYDLHLDRKSVVEGKRVDL